MIEVERCPECGVPKQIVEAHEWLNSGVIILKADPSMRMAFIECENLDPLYENIQELIGVPIERILIDVERKGTRDYFSPLLPQEFKEQLKSHELSLDPIIEGMIFNNRMNGLGVLELVSYSSEDDENDHITLINHNAYSVPLAMGDIAGGCEAALDKEHGNITRKEVSPGVYEITAAPSGIPQELKGRLERRGYVHREGDFELEKCPGCGGPAALSGFTWDLDNGVIINTATDRHVAILHPSVVDSVFEELANELGETIPELVIEAQRRFTKTGFHYVEEIEDEGEFRTQLALRGIGNLKSLSKDEKGLRMSVDNACMDLVLVGMVQGLYEIAFDTESEVKWQLSEEGDLSVEVTPKN
jgi:hypothetical protein